MDGKEPHSPHHRGGSCQCVRAATRREEGGTSRTIQSPKEGSKSPEVAGKRGFYQVKLADERKAQFRTIIHYEQWK